MNPRHPVVSSGPDRAATSLPGRPEHEVPDDAPEAAAARHARDFGLLLDALHDGVCALDAALVIRHANACAGHLLLRTRDRLLGTALAEVLDADPDGARPLVEACARLVADPTALGRDACWDLHLRDADGAPLPVEATLLAVRPSEDVAVVVVLQDQRPRAEARKARAEQMAAERANRAKSAFLSHLSHELRTPLNAVLGFAQILRLDGSHPLDAQQRTQVEQIEQAGWHLLRLIEQVLDLTRIDAGRTRVDDAALPVGEVTDEAVALVAPQAARRGVRILGGEGADLPPVRGDRVRLRQVLMNVLSNAVERNREGGTIDVQVEARTADDGREGVGWSIADSGDGLTVGQHAPLADAFDLPTERTGVEGAGIGLVIARRFVEEMHGHVGVRSEVGLGTTVTVWLPVNPPAADAGEPRA